MLSGPALQKLLPFIAWRHRVTALSLRDDVAAGLIGALVVLPQGVAFATLAGMPPIFGLYAPSCRRSSPRCGAPRGIW